MVQVNDNVYKNTDLKLRRRGIHFILWKIKKDC